jgi:LPS sulfotransferase NodH
MTHRSIFFAATHRSGSTLLLETIRTLDCLGQPGEYFYPKYIHELQLRLGLEQDLSPSSWLPAMRAEGSSPNGVFSAKVFADNIRWLSEKISGRPWPDGLDSLPGFFATHFPGAHFISIRRRDKLRQAISLHRAMQSGLWHSNQRSKVIASKAYYHREHIQWAISNIENQEKDLDALFKELDVVPVTYYYEDIVENLQGTLIEISGLVGEQLHDSRLPRIELKRMSDLQTDAWIERYQQEEQDAQGPGQADLTHTDEPVFEIILNQTSSPQLPGTRLQSKFQIRNLGQKPVRFIGHKGGRGSIQLMVQIKGPDGPYAGAERLPVPYELDAGEDMMLDFNIAIPRKAGTWSLEITAEQRGVANLCVTGSPRASLEGSGHLEQPLLTLFGDYEFTEDNWYYSSWFGFFCVKAWPWILSLNHGWLRITPGSPTSDPSLLCLKDSELGDWSTMGSSYPEIQTDQGRYLRYQKTVEEVRIFINDNGEEFQLPLSTRDNEG